MKPQKSIEHIKNYIDKSGYCFDEGMVENFYLCLKSSPLTMLLGADYCGKYDFAKSFCEAIGANSANGRFKLISVGSDSYDKNDFLADTEYFANEAKKDSENLYFIYLHNMNMSNPDSYLSAVYTAIDAKTLPENLYLTGGFDSDCDKYCISTKIKNRANIIPVHINDYKAKSNIKPITEKSSFLSRHINTDEKLKNDAFLLLDEINKSLCYINREISCKCKHEILTYLMFNKEYKLLEENEAFDNVILQRVLTKIEGNSAYIKTILSLLFKLCVPKGTGDYAASSLKMHRALTYPDCIYPKSAKQIALMTKRYEELGYI